MRRVFAALSVVALVAAACSGGGSDVSQSSFVISTTSTTATTPADETIPTDAGTAAALAEPTHGGVVVVADDQEPPTLNPYAEGGDNFIVSIIGQAHLAGAFDIDGTTLELIPELLSELPSAGNGGVSVNEDGTMTVRYEIRDEAVWSDGVPISGHDFEFTLDVMMNRRAGDIELPYDVVATEADAKTFEFTLATPTVVYEMMFPFVIPKHAVDDSDFLTDWNEAMWPAAGPFVFEEWQRGEYIRLIRNDNYWKQDPDTGDDLPYLNGVEFRFIPETESLIGAFSRRRVDVIQPPPAPETIDRLRDLESAGAAVHVRAGPVWEHLNFQFGPDNRNPDSLNEYTAFRQAVAYAMDSDVMAQLVGWEPITSILHPGVGEGPWTQYGYDVERATALLAEACELAGRDCATDSPQMVFSTTSNADARPRIADYVKATLADIGVDVELQLEDSQLFFGETLDDGTWDVGWWAWVTNAGISSSVGILDVFDPDAPAPDGGNYYRWGTTDSSVKDDAVDRFRDILAITRETVDPGEAATLAQAAEQILADNAVVIPVGARSVVGAVWADSIAGFVMNPSQASHTWNIEFWHRLDL